MKVDKIKIGVIGAGHLGKMHIENLKTIGGVELVGFFDTDIVRSKEISEELKLRAYSSLESLLNCCDGITIVVPTISHYKIARAAVLNGVHIFCEKPFMQTIDEANEIIKLAKEKNVKIQVGHIERFNPALTSLRQFKINPLFIESHRISPFNPRGIDVAVVLDLMIHDIDIILSLVDSAISQIDAAGAPVLTDNIDIANARIKFENGCVANVTASRVSNKKMRKLRIFQRKSYFSIDFLGNLTEVYILSDSKDNLSGIPLAELEAEKGHKKIILYQKLKAEKTNALREELLGFIESIRSGTEPAVTGEDGKKALEVAIQIESQIKSELEKTFSGYKEDTF